MHSIKLKAWYNDNQEIIDIDEIDFHHKLILSHKVPPNYISLQLKFEDIIFLKFTSLYDIDGNEIYEGDILCNSSINSLYTKAEVIFLNGCFCVRQLEGKRLIDNLYNHNSDSRIIGNIFKK